MKSNLWVALECAPNLARFKKAQSISVVLSTNISRAVAAHEMFARAAFRKDIPARFNNTYQAWGYNVIQNALISELIMTLTRMHDVDSRSASIPQLIKILGDPSIITALRDNARRWILERPSHHIGPAPEEILAAREIMKIRRADEEADKMENLAKNACRRAARFETNEMRATLHKFRNKHLAHSVLNPPTLNLKYSNLSTILMKTANIVDDLRLAVTGHHINSREDRKVWRTKAGHFWTHTVLPFKSQTAKRVARPRKTHDR